MSRSLQGLRVLNTRPYDQAQDLSEQIHRAGGVAIDLPTLSIEATHDWLTSVPDLNKIKQAIFISRNAVKHCFAQLIKHHIHWPETIEVIAIGQGSAAALKKYKVQVHTIPTISDSEHLLALNTLSAPQGTNILLIKGTGGRLLIEESLTAKGTNLIVLNVYQRIMPKINHQFIKSIWRDDLVDIILLTSEQSMHNLFKLFKEEAHYWLRSKTCLVLSERLAQNATVLGIKNIIRSHPDEIMNALFDYVIKD